MKNRRILLFGLCGLVFSGLWVTWQGCQSVWGTNPDFDATYLSPNGSTSFDFDIMSLPLINDQNINDNVPKDLKVFFSVGDGTFWQGTKDDFDQHLFIYSRQGTFSPFAELTSVYDDDQNPTGKIEPSGSIVIGSGNVSSDPPLRQNLSGKQIQLISNREPKPGDSLLYIITYEHNKESCLQNGVSGNIQFTFDDDILDYKAPYFFHGETATSSTNHVAISFPNLPYGEQRSLFLLFEVVSTAEEGDPFDAPKAMITANANNKDSCFMDESELSDQKIVKSHDPNHKFPAMEKICPTSTEALFTVTFQNDGTGETDSVIVTDELDVYLKDVAPVPKSWSTPNAPLVEKTSARNYRFVFKPLKLKGLHQTGFGTLFGEEETKATFTFSCALKDGFSADYPACNGIINRAKIYFDCNPPIVTEDAIIPIACEGCDTCSSVVTTVVLPDTLSFDTKLEIPPGVTSTLAGQGFRYHWYPASDVSSPNILTPRFIGKSNNRLTLIASKGDSACQRKVFHFVFANPCGLVIQVDASNVAPGKCAGQSTGYILATVSGSSGKVRWSNDCETDMSVKIPIETGKTRYDIGVTDLETGCFLETIHQLSEPAPLHVDDVPGNCQAKLFISGGTPPYSTNWSWQNSSGQPFAGTGTSIGLAQKINASVTVTDANGCSIVFRPIYPGNCRSWTGWGWGVLLAIAALLVWLLTRR